MPQARLDERVWKVTADDWEAIVVKVPESTSRYYPFKAFIYPPEGIRFPTHMVRVRAVQEVEEELREYKRLWAYESSEWAKATPVMPM